MKEYRKVDGLFDEFNKHIVSSRKKAEEPSDDTYRVGATTVYTLDDGMEIELCFWADGEINMSFWDVSVNRKMFESTGRGDINAYLREKGLYLEPVEDKSGPWEFGIITSDDIYRLQYAQDDEKIFLRELRMRFGKKSVSD